MKKILSMLLIVASACSPVRHVDVTRHNNYYERHRMNTFTSPTWVPGFGVILQTHIIPYRSLKSYQKNDMDKRSARRKH